jgi:hypothetical protein
MRVDAGEVVGRGAAGVGVGEGREEGEAEVDAAGEAPDERGEEGRGEAGLVEVDERVGEGAERGDGPVGGECDDGVGRGREGYAEGGKGKVGASSDAGEAGLEAGREGRREVSEEVASTEGLRLVDGAVGERELEERGRGELEGLGEALGALVRGKQREGEDEVEGGRTRSCEGGLEGEGGLGEAEGATDDGGGEVAAERGARRFEACAGGMRGWERGERREREGADAGAVANVDHRHGRWVEAEGEDEAESASWDGDGELFGYGAGAEARGRGRGEGAVRRGDEGRVDVTSEGEVNARGVCGLEGEDEVDDATVGGEEAIKGEGSAERGCGRDL